MDIPRDESGKALTWDGLESKARRSIRPVAWGILVNEADEVAGHMEIEAGYTYELIGGPTPFDKNDFALENYFVAARGRGRGRRP